MNTALSDKDYIKHILHAIDNIGNYIGASGKNGFFLDEKTQDAVIRNLEVIGEAVSKLSSTLKSKYNEIPWRQRSGMRNRLLRDYMSTDLKEIWNAAEKEMPRLRRQIERIDRTLS